MIPCELPLLLSAETGTYVSIMLIHPTINKNKLLAAGHLKLLRMGFFVCFFANTRVNWKILLCS